MPNNVCPWLINRPSRHSCCIWENHGLNYRMHTITIPWKASQTAIKTSDKEIIFQPVYILHYFNKEKPWDLNYNWSDADMWWEFWNSIFNNNPELMENSEMYLINEKMFQHKKSTTCLYCEFLNSINVRGISIFNHDTNHHMVDKTVTCPHLRKSQIKK